MIQIQRILCPTDFSDFSDYAMQYACELAERYRAEVHLLNVVQDYSAVSPASGDACVPFTDWLPKLRQDSQDQLAKLPGPDWTSRLIAVVRTTRIGTPVEEITKYAEEHAIDLIVQGTHGRRGVKHMLLGSVAENIVRYATCPVLTARKPASES